MSSNLIAHIKKFVSLKESDELLLLDSLKPAVIKKKEFLLKEGQVCKSNYFVEKGCLRLFFINEKGTEQITQFAIENWWLSDYMSLDRQSPSSFYIQSIENSEIVSLDTSSQIQLFQQIPLLETYMRIVQQKAYAASQFRVRFLYEHSKEESYHHFISHFPQFIQRIPQYMLASYLGFTPEYLSELRNRVNK